jgi:hypothetical protein
MIRPLARAWHNVIEREDWRDGDRDRQTDRESVCAGCALGVFCVRVRERGREGEGEGESAGWTL